MDDTNLFGISTHLFIEKCFKVNSPPIKRPEFRSFNCSSFKKFTRRRYRGPVYLLNVGESIKKYRSEINASVFRKRNLKRIKQHQRKKRKLAQFVPRKSSECFDDMDMHVFLHELDFSRVELNLTQDMEADFSKHTHSELVTMVDETNELRSRKTQPFDLGVVSFLEKEVFLNNEKQILYPRLEQTAEYVNNSPTERCIEKNETLGKFLHEASPKTAKKPNIPDIVVSRKLLELNSSLGNNLARLKSIESVPAIECTKNQVDVTPKEVVSDAGEETRNTWEFVFTRHPHQAKHRFWPPIDSYQFTGQNFPTDFNEERSGASLLIQETDDLDNAVIVRLLNLQLNKSQPIKNRKLNSTLAEARRGMVKNFERFSDRSVKQIKQNIFLENIVRQLEAPLIIPGIFDLNIVQLEERETAYRDPPIPFFPDRPDRQRPNINQNIRPSIHPQFLLLNEQTNDALQFSGRVSEPNINTSVEKLRLDKKIKIFNDSSISSKYLTLLEIANKGLETEIPRDTLFTKVNTHKLSGIIMNLLEWQSAGMIRLQQSGDTSYITHVIFTLNSYFQEYTNHCISV